MIELRRKDRATKPGEAHELLESTEVGFLGTTGSDGIPYVVPVNYVCTQNTIYFHCAPAGRKLTNLQQNPSVCFTVIGPHQVVPSSSAQPCPSTTHYQSVVAFGRARIVADPAEKGAALTALVHKLIPDRTYEPLTPAALQRIVMVAVEIEHITGKRHDHAQ